MIEINFSARFFLNKFQIKFFNLFQIFTMETVWARDPVEGFVLGRISELLQDGAEVVPLDSKFQRRVCQFSDIFPASDIEKIKTYDDNCNN